MEKLIYEIGGKKYLLFDYPFTDNSRFQKFQKTIQKFNGIVQGAEVKQGWFSGKANVRVLIPEEKALEFSNYDHT